LTRTYTRRTEITVDFFELPPPPPRDPFTHQPAWAGPPENTIGAPVELRVLLAHTEQAALGCQRFVSYPSGFEFELTVRLRSEEEAPVDIEQALYGWHRPRPRRGAKDGREIDPEVLRFGIRFADGSKVTNLMGFPHNEVGSPEGPVLMQRGGGGGGRCWDQGYWVWPLPPAGKLGFACEWPAAGIPFTISEIDSDPILSAAPRAEILWSDELRG
jgi:hypothetical protein